MCIDFKNIDYLKHGNERQRRAFKDIRTYGILEKLKKYNPVLTGTIPIGIDIPGSDLDIICECEHHGEFINVLTEEFSIHDGFKVYSTIQNEIESTIAEFNIDYFRIEIFGQNIPTEQQNAFRHMIIEHHILKEQSDEFKRKIIELKSTGIKTEPAFAKLLGLSGDPYKKLLELEKYYM